MRRRWLTLATVLAVAGCAPAEPTQPSTPFNGVPPLLISHPNEPAGFTAIASLNGGALPTSTWGTVAGGIGKWILYSTGSNLTLANDSTATGSPDSVISTRYPNGWTSGTAPVWFAGWEGTSSGTPTQYSELYVHQWVFIGDSTGYQNEPVGTKFGFVGYADAPSNARNQGLWQLKGNNSVSVMTSIPFWFRQQGNVTRSMSANVGPGSISAGAWHDIETHFKINSAADSADGVLEIWVDGVATHSYSDVVYMTTGKTRKFQWYAWDPVWGGNTGATRTRKDYVLMDHLYLSAKS